MTFQPVVLNESLNRLAARSANRNGNTDVWTDVLAEVQRQLAILEAEVCRKVPGVRVNSGRSQGPFFVFSYRAFSLPDSRLDPVVAGVTFKSADGGIAVEADVCDDNTGECIADAFSTVANSLDDLLAATRESAHRLLQAAEVIVAALADLSRTPG